MHSDNKKGRHRENLSLICFPNAQGGFGQRQELRTPFRPATWYQPTCYMVATGNTKDHFLQTAQSLMGRKLWKSALKAEWYTKQCAESTAEHKRCFPWDPGSI